MTKNNSQLAIFDFAKALALAGNNKASLKQNLTIFTNNIDTEIDKLNQALEQKDIETIAKIAHKMNGSCSYMAAEQIKTSCEQVFLACKAGNFNILKQLIDNLQQQTIVFLNTIKTRKVLEVLN